MTMKKIILFLCVTFLLNFHCYAQTVSSTELIENAKQYDARTVTYQGEVIGDIMVRGEHAWLSVNDGSNAIGVWIDKELIKQILYVGSYTAEGDLVEIMGTFHRSCIEHGGDLDIHAQSIAILRLGHAISHALNRKALHCAVGLLCIITLVILLTMRHRPQIPL